MMTPMHRWSPGFRVWFSVQRLRPAVSGNLFWYSPRNFSSSRMDNIYYTQTSNRDYSFPVNSHNLFIVAHNRLLMFMHVLLIFAIEHNIIAMSFLIIIWVFDDGHEDIILHYYNATVIVIFKYNSFDEPRRHANDIILLLTKHCAPTSNLLYLHVYVDNVKYCDSGVRKWETDISNRRKSRGNWGKRCTMILADRNNRGVLNRR